MNGYLTVPEAYNTGLIQLTEFSPSNEKIETTSGKLTIEQWLESERVRITSDKSRRAAIVQSGRDLALFVNPHPDRR